MGGFLFMIVLGPLFILSVLTSGLVILLSGKGKRKAAIRVILMMYGVGSGLLILGEMTLVTVSSINSPMSVDRSDVIGTYKVDKNMFTGPQANWQHDHFTMTITDEDTLILRSLDINGAWHEYMRPIVPVQGAHSYLWRFSTEGDSTMHHILINTPTLHRQQWSFYYSFQSPRFGTVFFRKE